MKKLAVFLLIVACFFSSPNCGVLFASGPVSTVDTVFFKQGLPDLKTTKSPAKITELSQTLKKPRLLKRVLFTLDLQELLSFSLLVVCLALFCPLIAAFSKPVQLFLRSPPQR